MMTEMSIMMIYLFWEMESTALAIASGIFQFASTQPKGPEQAMIIMMTALVRADPFIISKRPLSVRSL